MKRGWIYIIIACTLVLSACSLKLIAKASAELTNIEIKYTKAETKEYPFIYRLVTEKGEYEVGEEVKIYAELEYTGPNDEVTIYHAASPFYFPMVEQIRGYHIEYPMAEPLIKTTLKKGEPYREEYKRSGAFIANDDQKFIKFMESFIKDGFPTGYYLVNGEADFFLSDSPNLDDRIPFEMKAQIEFKVVK